MPRKPSYTMLEQELRQTREELTLYQLAFGWSRTMDCDATAEVPERDSDGKVTGSWYRYSVYNSAGPTGGILIVTFTHPNQREQVTPTYFERWRRMATLLPHERAALLKLEVALYKRKQRLIAKGEASANAATSRR